MFGVVKGNGLGVQQEWALVSSPDAPRLCLLTWISFSRRLISVSWVGG